jgi:hypothetical protein
MTAFVQDEAFVQDDDVCGLEREATATADSLRDDKQMTGNGEDVLAD